ncbi:hypothetical protein [Paenibacillus mucilaginosus]|uniref:Uncharacterized protein n=3 Tax=Paenibacillus mucilaginosus TaxID=61624 RepID=H6N9A1_9BACL|nr:hypothetical protein [Paenibacillus mucilaginosus]AEI39605.1 hypothetical protein KNP414_01015 [Paenibacillus mucilaginosus KNP414]AFC27847.1 hypothetical protein PM3016_903 [Paenibacillus mucilaginosus 3016]AFH60001.1 hypothetical protein B2K_04580 [Paenibacillus mucilaginosus K02]MCG7218023.1 hypothetical protein [Paenibacillus mucilaginosus]WDM28549.1 hypothetical protein KCX80_04705 [Paenibacillus mucilaginosus]
MGKLITLCLTVVLIFGICTYIFRPQGGSGLTEEVRDGHETVTGTLRGFDYVTD